MSRFQLVADHRDTFEVKWLCEIVEVSRSSFYAWLDGADARAERAAADAALAERIRTVQRTEGTEYGAPRITAELNDGTIVGDDGRVNHKRVARVMRAHGIAGSGCGARSAPPSRSRPMTRSLTCSSATSPRQRRTRSTSATSNADVGI